MPLDPKADAHYWVQRQNHENDHLRHRLMVDSRILKDRLNKWRAIACALALLAILGWYGLIMSWTAW